MVESTSPPSYAYTGNLGDHTNIWGIGAVMIRPMNGEGSGGGRSGDHPNYKSVRDIEPELNDDATEKYSTYWCELVEECVRFRTYHRISLDELWTNIQRYTSQANAAFDPDKDGDDRRGTERVKIAIRLNKFGPPFDDEGYLYYPKDSYKIDLAKDVVREVGGDRTTGWATIN